MAFVAHVMENVKIGRHCFVKVLQHSFFDSLCSNEWKCQLKAASNHSTLYVYVWIKRRKHVSQWHRQIRAYSYWQSVMQ